MTGHTPGEPPAPHEQWPGVAHPWPAPPATDGHHAHSAPAGFGPPPPPFEQRTVVDHRPARRRWYTGRPAVIAAALAAVLLVGGAAAYLTLGRDKPTEPVAQGGNAPPGPSGSPSVDQGDGRGAGGGPDFDPNAGIRPGEARVWVRDNQTQVPSGTLQYGPWRVGDVVVKAMYKEVTGYAVADGREKWKVSLQTPLCGAPQAPAATGRLVIGVRQSDSATARCTDLQQVDLTTGTLGWKITVPQENPYDTGLGFDMAIAGDTVALARSAVMSGFSVADGRKLFGTANTNGCYPTAFAGGGQRLVVVRHCTDPKDPGGPGQDMVQEVDPATASPRWSHQYDKSWRLGRVLTMDPLVVALSDKNRKVWGITAFAADGKVRSEGELGFGVSGRCNGFGNAGDIQGCYAAAADADTLYLGAGRPGKSLGTDDTNQVVAVDLNTGKERWRTAEQPKGRTMWPLAVENGRVVVYVAAGSGAAASVVSLAPADGASQPVLQSPAAAAGPQSALYPFSLRAGWAGGRVFVLNGSVGSPDTRKVSIALLSFGT
ncbi:outer membrane protein assembly factor BamB family protein [Streptomyces bambusae]|uniref:PQQ-binding-like beta-propeller repeat protein n=1 Tax=Streptomyces bambusae TaxID=1550616 RepID=A0ABS6ZB94_9ACTN|nr:PQQ-binding-like beta-propeller repeat protein [Streptomyces bambusae]MBW5485038.1 PQQ-binding-like beta-propeller repeat protein [Streptomyces bambusae]